MTTKSSSALLGASSGSPQYEMCRSSRMAMSSSVALLRPTTSVNSGTRKRSSGFTWRSISA